jgi:hypothetical protein
LTLKLPAQFNKRRQTIRVVAAPGRLASNLLRRPVP